MKFSIIIPAWNEEEFVASAIHGAKAQQYPRADFEIVVVDNNSTDQTIAIAKAAGADKVVKEKEQGTNMARNRGVRESSGDILAYIDADCVPPVDWLSRIEEVFKDPSVVALSGPYEMGFTGMLRVADRFYTGFVFKAMPDVVTFIFRKKDAVMIGGNFAVRRSAITKIGEFPRLRFYGDDTAIAISLARNAGRVIFDPTFMVKSSPRRLKSQGLLRTVVRYAYHHFKVYFTHSFDKMRG